MRFLKIVALSVALLTTAQAVQQPSFHTKGTPTGKPTGQLKPGEYWWKPQLSQTRRGRQPREIGSSVPWFGFPVGYAVSGVLLTVFGYFAMLLSQ